MAGPRIRARTGLHQKIPFGALVFSLGSGTAPLPRRLLLRVRTPAPPYPSTLVAAKAIGSNRIYGHACYEQRLSKRRLREQRPNPCFCRGTQAEDMIKLPIVLRAREDWKAVVGDAIRWRDQLEDIAKTERIVTQEYIRPIILFQAQRQAREKATTTPSVLKQILINDFRISEDQIKIATGSEWELSDINLFKDDCLVRYIITVQALREGWDCSFAYVLCSISEQQSPRAVEQLLGRVLRLPNAKRKVRQELNEAYAFAATLSFKDTANALVEGLVENGFEQFEARALFGKPNLTAFRTVEQLTSTRKGYPRSRILRRSSSVSKPRPQGA